MIDAHKRQPRDRLSKQFDAEASLAEARSRLPLKRLIEQNGFAPESGRWKGFRCPFCQKKDKASVYEKDGQELFRCFSNSCPTRGHAEAFDEVGFLAYISSLSRKEAFTAYLKQAGVWKERATLKSPKPEKTPPASPDGARPADPAGDSTGDGAAGGAVVRGAEGSDDSPMAESESGAPTPETDAPAGDADEAAGPPVNGDFPATAVVPPSVESPTPAESGPSDREQPHAPSPEVHSESSIQPTGDGAAGKEGEAADDKDRRAAKEGAAEERGDGKEAPGPVVTGIDVVRRFYAALPPLGAEDHELLWRKRGLESATIEALGFRSNPKSNKDVLTAIGKEFDSDILLDSGLWKRRRGQLGVAGQFYGAGRIRLLKEGESPGAGEWADEDGWLWGWTHPVLIPYVDEDGRLINLRPHKGMGVAGTVAGSPQPYFPRPVRTEAEGDKTRAWEFFRTVVITEGEFKAAALWQILGSGRKDGRKPIGVAALPGISFARHYETREMLDLFLRKTKAERVIVVFDNEDKGDESKPGYKADWQKRHDAEIAARYLAMDLHQKLRLHCRVGTIPSSWRDDKGKADWDGMMATMAAMAPVEGVAA